MRAVEVLVGQRAGTPMGGTRDLTYRVPVSDFCAKYFDDLWKGIEKWAADELRSVKGQIEYVLRQTVGRRKPDSPKDE